MTINAKLTACKTCAKEISKTATVCPSCGEKNPHGKSSSIMLVLVAFLGIWIFIQCLQVLGNAIKGPAYSKADGGAGNEAHKEAMWMLTGQDAVKEKLKDPGSAKFKGVFFHRGKDNVPMTCGYVQSKNGFGGYGGFQRFVSAGKPELTYLEEEVADFRNVWKRLCEG